MTLVDVTCPDHGFLAAVVPGAEVYCRGCDRFYTAADPEATTS